MAIARSVNVSIPTRAVKRNIPSERVLFFILHTPPHAPTLPLFPHSPSSRVLRPTFTCCCGQPSSCIVSLWSRLIARPWSRGPPVLRPSPRRAPTQASAGSSPPAPSSVIIGSSGSSGSKQCRREHRASRWRARCPGASRSGDRSSNRAQGDRVARTPRTLSLGRRARVGLAAPLSSTADPL